MGSPDGSGHQREAFTSTSSHLENRTVPWDFMLNISAVVKKSAKEGRENEATKVAKDNDQADESRASEAIDQADESRASEESETKADESRASEAEEETGRGSEAAAEINARSQRRKSTPEVNPGNQRQNSTPGNLRSIEHECFKTAFYNSNLLGLLLIVAIALATRRVFSNFFRRVHERVGCLKGPDSDTGACVARGCNAIPKEFFVQVGERCLSLCRPPTAGKVLSNFGADTWIMRNGKRITGDDAVFRSCSDLAAKFVIVDVFRKLSEGARRPVLKETDYYYIGSDVGKTIRPEARRLLTKFTNSLVTKAL